MASPDQVAAMAQQIKSVVKREGWTADQSVAPSMQQILGKLTTLKVDVDLLKQTNIGAMVRKLTKHDDEIVRGYSTSLMNKWMAQVGMKDKDKPSASRDSGSNNSNNRISSGGGGGNSGGNASEATTGAGADTKRFEQARKRLQDGYASEKAKRDSRTVQVLTRPVAKGRKGTTISAAPSRSTISQNRLMQQRRTVALSRTSTVRAASAPPASRPADPSGRRVVTPGATRPSGVLSREEQHRIRQQKLRALREKNLRENGSLNDVYRSEPSRTSGGAAAGQRASASSAPSSRVATKFPSGSSGAASRSSGTNRAAFEPPVSDRKAFLDKMFPRVCGTAGAPPPPRSGGTKKSPTNKAGAAAGSGGAKKKGGPLNEGQREVLAWLKGLEVDMSDYAPAFFENGFDSIKLLGNIEKEDLPGLIPKKGHHRLIQQALDDLKRKHRTAASSRSQSARGRDRPMPKRGNPYSDEDSDDSFVVSDGDEYTPGVISGMFRKNRKRSYSFDSLDSYNMEASFDEIQHEEERSTRYGEYEDYREELRNKKLLKKKK